EGTYRLRFSLFEESKEPAAANPDDAEAPQAYVFHRIEVESQPFTVFSAKKFPGLSESTALPSTVPLQACRVRIRRDVRMRRRSDKHGSGDKDEDETARYRAKRQASPDGYQPQSQPDRKRSDSMISSAPAQQAPMAQPFNNSYHPPTVQPAYQDYNARPRSPVS